MRPVLNRLAVPTTAETALVTRFSGVETAVEVGIGRRPDVARSLAATGVSVTATDIESRPVPPGVSFEVDDVTDPDLTIYAGRDLVYALRAPPDLHRAIRDVAREAGAVACITTLGSDHPAVPVRTETVGGVGLFWVHEPGNHRRGPGLDRKTEPP